MLLQINRPSWSQLWSMRYNVLLTNRIADFRPNFAICLKRLEIYGWPFRSGTIFESYWSNKFPIILHVCLIFVEKGNLKFSDSCGQCKGKTADCGLRTADCGLRTADCGLRTADRGPGVKCRLCVKCRLQTKSKTQTGLKCRPSINCSHGRV